MHTSVIGDSFPLINNTVVGKTDALFLPFMAKSLLIRRTPPVLLSKQLKYVLRLLLICLSLLEMALISIDYGFR
jgi:hypothetical protein